MVQVIDGIVRIGDTSYELQPVLELERGGQKVTLRGYVNGRRCPVDVHAAMAGIWDKADEMRQKPAGAMVMNRDFLMACIDGLEEGEASVIATDPEVVYEILCQLKWWRRVETVAEGEANGEETTTADPSITATSSPGSTSSTDPGTGDA